MTYGIKVLRKLQFGRETTAGTAVPATTKWRGSGVLQDARDHVFVEEEIGNMAGVTRSYMPKLLGQLSLESIPATFEQLPHLFEMGIAAQGTGVVDTGGSGFIYTYTGPTTAVNTPKFYTIEGGDNTEAEEMEYCHAAKITLDGKAGEAIMMAADVVGRQVALSTFTTDGAAPLPTVEEILFSKGLMYMDAVSGTMGTTPVSNTLLDMNLEINTGLTPVWTADGQLYYSFVKSTGPEILLGLTFEHDATGQAVKVDWRARTPRLIRLKFSGSLLTTAGTYTNKTLQLDMAGMWDSVDALGEQDGNDTVKGTFRVRYDATAAKFFIATVVNELTTIP